VRKAILALMLLAAAGCTGQAAGSYGTALVGKVPVAGGPTAEQLAHGYWVRIPAAPIRLCDGQPVWDGHEILMVEPGGYPPCQSAAALYNPTANRWKRIAAPPRGADGPDMAWGGGRLLMVSWYSGVVVAWDRATGRWQRLPGFPKKTAVSVGWTGREFIVITARQLGPNKGTASAFELRGNRWTRLPDLPQPGRGRVLVATMATYGGSVYAVAQVRLWHLDPNDTYVVDRAELLRLTRSSWVKMPLPSGVPSSLQVLTQVSGALLAAGSSCDMCTIWNGAAALVTPGPRTLVVPFRPRPGVPYPYDFAAGPHAIAVLYFDGLGFPGPRHYGPKPGSSLIYDIATGRWLKGPTAPETSADQSSTPGAVWTPYGVAMLSQEIVNNVSHGRPGGWLLRPR